MGKPSSAILDMNRKSMSMKQINMIYYQPRLVTIGNIM